MASERTPNWLSLKIEESGGFAGLRRGVAVQRSGMDDPRARTIEALVTTIHSKYVPRSGTASAPIPDSQTLRLHLKSEAGEWDAIFDTADLPEEVADLVDQLPPLRPVSGS